MSLKKKKANPKDPLVMAKDFVAAGQAAQGAVDDQTRGVLPLLLLKDIYSWQRKIQPHREYFRGEGINPYRSGLLALLKAHDDFDGVAGGQGIATK